jgi:hypothetical protein
MSKDIYNTVLEELAEELVVNSKGMSLYSKNILASLIKNKAEEYKLHKIKPTEEDLKEIDTLLETVTDTLIKSREYNNKLYKISYDKLKALLDEGSSYRELFTEVYDDEGYLNDIFIRLIEEKEGVAITSAKQLQELSGITEVYGYWDNETEKIKPYPGRKAISTKKEAQEEALRQIEHTLTQGMYNRYFTTLEDMLEAGAKYKDILLLSPKDFNLPDQWSGTLAKNKEEVILWAIGLTFLINEPGSLMLVPSLRTVAEEIGAPYSVLMDCYKLFNK